MNKIIKLILKFIVSDKTKFKRIESIIENKEKKSHIYAFGSASVGGGGGQLVMITFLLHII